MQDMLRYYDILPVLVLILYFLQCKTCCFSHWMVAAVVACSREDNRLLCWKYMYYCCS